MNKLLLTFLLSACTVLTACACPKSHEDATPVNVALLTPPAGLGLALYEPQSDVAYLTSSVRHVLSSADSTATTTTDRAKQEELSPNSIATAQALNTKPPPRLPHVVGHSEVDSVYEAWLKFCDDAQDLSTTEWAVIDATKMPSELENIWAKDCIPLR